MPSHWEVVNGAKIIVSNTPEDLWHNACRYFKWSDDNPLETKGAVKVGKAAGNETKTEVPRPYSIKALCLHCGIMEEYLKDVRNTQDKHSLFYIVVSKILYIIFIQNAELATIGVYNPIFTARMLNLDKDDTPSSSVKVEIVNGLPALSTSEAEVLEKLEKRFFIFQDAKEQF